MKITMNHKKTLLIIAGPVALWVIALVLIPCAALLLSSLLPLSGDGDLSLENYEKLADSKVAAQAFIRTLKVSVWVTLFTIIGGYPLALAIARARRGARSLLLAIVIFPFLLSAVVRAYGWNVILGDKGLINSVLLEAGLLQESMRLIHNDLAIIIGETHLLLPYMVLALLAVIQRIDPALEDAAKSLGATPPVVFSKIVLPMTLPGLLTGTLLVFSLAMTAFATPFLLGGTRSPVLTVLLYRYAFTLYDWSKAAAVGVILLLLGVVFVTLHRFASRRQLRGYGMVS